MFILTCIVEIIYVMQPNMNSLTEFGINYPIVSLYFISIFICRGLWANLYANAKYMLTYESKYMENFLSVRQTNLLLKSVSLCFIHKCAFLPIGALPCKWPNASSPDSQNRNIQNQVQCPHALKGGLVKQSSVKFARQSRTKRTLNETENTKVNHLLYFSLNTTSCSRPALNSHSWVSFGCHLNLLQNQ